MWYTTLYSPVSRKCIATNPLGLLLSYTQHQEKMKITWKWSVVKMETEHFWDGNTIHTSFIWWLLIPWIGQISVNDLFSCFKVVLKVGVFPSFSYIATGTTNTRPAPILHEIRKRRLYSIVVGRKEDSHIPSTLSKCRGSPQSRQKVRGDGPDYKFTKIDFWPQFFSNRISR